MGLGITEDKIAKAHVFLHQAAKVYTHLLGVFVYKTKALGFGLGPVVALGTLKDKRHERIVLADIAEKLQTGIRTLLTSESISTMLGLSLCFHLIAKGLGGTLQRETGIADDTKSIVGILVIEFLSFFVSTSQNHLGSTTHTHGGSMTVQCLLGEVLALFQYVIVEIGKNGTVEADGIFDKEYHLNSGFLNIVFQIHLVLYQLDEGKNEIGIAQPAEHIVEDAQVFVLHTLGDAMREGSKHHAMDIGEPALDISCHIEGIIVGITRHTDNQINNSGAKHF